MRLPARGGWGLDLAFRVAAAVRDTPGPHEKRAVFAHTSKSSRVGLKSTEELAARVLTSIYFDETTTCEAVPGSNAGRDSRPRPSPKSRP